MNIHDYKCIFCTEVFDNKEELQVHFRKHGDPKFDQNSKAKYRQRSELQTSEAKKSESENEVVSCDVCSEVFQTISKAITHKHKVHPEHDVKYFCPWCGKLFTMKHLYNKHVKSNHGDKEEDLTNILQCDSCNVRFQVPAAMLYHNKFFHRQDTDLPSLGHSKLQKMFQQELLHLYFCPFCGEEYINKVNLNKHINDDHSDENQLPDEVLRCPLCEAIFYHLDAYELHLTFHTSDDVYNETNEINEKTITEYSLETVPPISEKVENIDSQHDPESSINAVGIDKFLELLVNDNSNSEGFTEKVKHKKHKKHKKSKKSAITLDEFLSMNKDVFGEGLGDVQGIEEVPTQIVAKHLKSSKKVQQSQPKKVITAHNLEKLKKQGIIVKVKSQYPNTLNSKIKSNILQNRPYTATKTLNTSDAVLSKLLNQSNSQIKIVKKQVLPSFDNNTNKQDDKEFTQPLSPNGKPTEASGPISETESEVANPLESNQKESEVEEKTSMHSSSSLDSKNLDPEISEMKMNEVSSTVTETINPLQNICKSVKIKTVSNLDKNVSKISTKTFLAPGDLRNRAEVKSDQKCNLKSFLEENNQLNDKNSIKPSSLPRPNNLQTYSELSNDAETCTVQQQIALNSLKRLGDLTIKSSNHNCSLENQQNIKENVKSYGTLEKTESPQETQICTSSLEYLHENNMDKNKSALVSHCTKTLEAMEKLKQLSNNFTIKSRQNSNLNTTQNLKYNMQEQVKTRPDEEILQTQKMQIPTKAKNLTTEDINHKETHQEKKNSEENRKFLKLTPQPYSSSFNDEDFSDENDEDIINSSNKACEQKIRDCKNMSSSPTALVTEPRSKLGSDASEKLKGSYEISNKESPSNILLRLKNLSGNQLNISNSKPKDIEANVKIPIKKTLSPKLQKSDQEPVIFNVDDSDDEIETKLLHNTEITNSNKKRFTDNNTIANINNQVSNNKQSLNVVKHSLEQSKQAMQGVKNNDETIKKVLKNLGKNISIKSNISDQDLDSDDPFIKDNYDETDSNSNSSFNVVKISELTEKEDTNESVLSHEALNDGNAIVESPGNSNDERESDDVNLDVEKKIQNTTVLKPLCCKPEESTFLSDSKTIPKYDNDNNAQKILSQLSKNISVKPIIKNFEPSERNFNNSSINKSAHQSINQKITNSCSKNVISKEVTTKTIEGETIIEEVTTVTKTIRTINKMFQREYHDSNQSVNKMATQRTTQQIRPQQINNYHGVKVRPANLKPQFPNQIRPARIRSAIGATIKPANQVLPIRPGLTLPRLISPKTPLNKNVPLIQSSAQTLNKPLKLSPNVRIGATVKRSAGEVPGPFSCFKKPKESLIPETNVTFQNNESETVSYSSTSSLSNVASVTEKVCKGNNVVQSFQTKAEMSSKINQISRLSNISGLKVVKTSQAKQTAQVVEEKCIKTSSQLNALAALDKLQKQGVLIKKPQTDLPSHLDSDEMDEDS